MLFQIVHSILRMECGFSDESKFLVGVSGGPDSICLLDILTQFPYEIIIGHLNHNLRQSSNEEMEFVEKLAKKYGCKFIAKSLSIKQLSELNKTGIEETARKERYRFLFNSAIIEKADAVLVAHQADDQIETMLMNIIRGTGLEGISGMRLKTLSEFNDTIPLVRPFLRSWRKDIMDYCQLHRLEFRIDESNKSLSNTRASIRNHLIPEIMKYNPNFKATFLRTQQIMEEDFGFLQESISAGEEDVRLKYQNDTASLDLEAFNALFKSLQRLIIKDMLEKFFYESELISFSNIEKIRKMFIREIKKSSLKINKDLYVFTIDKRGILTKDDDIEGKYNYPRIESEFRITIQPGKNKIGKEWQFEINELTRSEIANNYLKNQDSYLCYMDGEKVGREFKIRPWIYGDRFQPLGMKGKSIKLSDYWINRKVPQNARKKWPLILCGEEILWIPGYQQANSSRITDMTQRIIVLRLVPQS